MRLDWLEWSNPVAVWWCFLITVSALNIALLFGLFAASRKSASRGRNVTLVIEPLVLLSGAYVFGCAFRSILPRADVQRICLFDTWLSSVMVGRSVATVAELSHSDTAKNIAKLIVPLIALAECCSWYAVISTDFLGNVLENSLWTVTFLLIAVALLRLVFSFRGIAQSAI